MQDDRIHASLYTDPRIFADEPVIMVRGKDGAVAVLVNRCMHRGTMLCPAERGHVRTSACPYRRANLAFLI